MFRHLSHTTLIGVAIVLAGLTGAASAIGEPSGVAQASTLRPCRTSDLSARIVAGSPGAGQRYATLLLTNRSRHTCHTYGYVGMLFLDAHGRAVVTDVVRDHYTNPHRVVLAPGRRAAAVLHWTVVQGTGDGRGPCVTPPRRVEITPPDEFSHLTIRWRGGVVCQRGRIDVTPLVYAG
jgi:hypothetical protein